MYILALALLCTLSSSHTLHSMQSTSKTDLSQRLALSNETPWELIAVHTNTKKEDVQIGTTLIAGSKTILENPKSMTSLILIPATEHVGEPQKFKPNNLIDSLNGLLGDAEIMVTISAPQGIDKIEDLTEFSYMPKRISSEDLELAIAPSKNAQRLDAFPVVKYLIENGEIPFPRHYLAIPDNKLISEEASLNEAYTRLSNHWERLKECDELYRNKILAILKMAYSTCKTQREFPLTKAGKRLIKLGHTVTIEGTILEKSDKAVLEAYEKATCMLLLFKGTIAGDTVLNCLQNEFTLIMMKIGYRS